MNRRLALAVALLASVSFFASFGQQADAGGADATVILGLPQMEDGKARVSATTAQLSCSGKHRIRGSDGGTRESPLELVKKVALGD